MFWVGKPVSKVIEYERQNIDILHHGFCPQTLFVRTYDQLDFYPEIFECLAI